MQKLPGIISYMFVECDIGVKVSVLLAGAPARTVVGAAIRNEINDLGDCSTAPGPE